MKNQKESTRHLAGENTGSQGASLVPTGHGCCRRLTWASSGGGSGPASLTPLVLQGHRRIPGYSGECLEAAGPLLFWGDESLTRLHQSADLGCRQFILAILHVQRSVSSCFCLNFALSEGGRSPDPLVRENHWSQFTSTPLLHIT